jgi:hypothetical protein
MERTVELEVSEPSSRRRCSTAAGVATAVARNAWLKRPRRTLSSMQAGSGQT